jgi:AbrB family looped-hinge helix DNA binding protein
MSQTTVTSKGQVTIPVEVRKRLGIRTGSRVAIELVGKHAEIRVVEQPQSVPRDGFGMLKSRKSGLPADFDPAALLRKGRAR